MKHRRILKIAAVIAVAHLTAALGSLALGFAIGARRWDSGSPGILESVADGVAGVLLQPGSHLWRMGMSGDLEWAIIVGNSALWGTVGALVIVGIARASR